MSTPISTREVARVIADTGMGVVQAYHHVQARKALQDLIARQRREAAARCVRLYAERGAL